MLKSTALTRTYYLFFFLSRPPMFRSPLILGASKVGRYRMFCRVSEAVTQSPGPHSQFLFARFIWRLTPGLGAHICVMHCTASCTQIHLKGEKTKLRLVQGVDFPSCPCPHTIFLKGEHFKLTGLYLYRLESEWLVVSSVVKISQSTLQGSVTSTEATRASATATTQHFTISHAQPGIIKHVFIGRAEREGMLAGSFPMYPLWKCPWLFKFHLNNQLRQICLYQKAECDGAKPEWCLRTLTK